MKSQDLIDKIRSLKKLTPSEAKIAEYFSRNYAEIVFENVTSISQKTGVSKATVVRFISKLGYHKFSAFRNELRHSALLQRKPLPTRYTFKKKQVKDEWCGYSGTQFFRYHEESAGYASTD